MKLDLQSLSAEPLVYMLMHSGAFVAVLGLVFFLIGLLFGFACWGRYKGRTRQLRAEAEATKEEVASLKRKVAELSVKSGPAVPMMTEMITLPRKELSTPAAGDRKPAAPGGPPAPPPATTADVTRPAPAPNGTAPTLSAEHAVLPAVATQPPPDEDHPASPLASIIAPAAAPSKKETEPPPGHDLLLLPEIPLSGTPARAGGQAGKAMFDPHLGIVYRTRPDQIDDLTALKGVAAPLAERLHALGVYTYEQIAGWTQDQVREFSTRLSFKDRIQREEWVEQARGLLADRLHEAKEPAGAMSAAS